jgi:hypothetical protein
MSGAFLVIFRRVAQIGDVRVKTMISDIQQRITERSYRDDRRPRSADFSAARLSGATWSSRSGVAARIGLR